MKKFRVLLVLVVILISSILCASLTACGGGNDDSSSEKITITYYLKDGEPPLRVKAKRYEEFKFSLHSLKRTHYTFAGMYDETNGNGNLIIDTNGKSTIAFADDITVYVFWIPETYTLEFDAGEGNLNDNEKTKSIQYGANIGLLPEPTLEGYDFDGWFIGEYRITTGGVAESNKGVLLDTNYAFPDEGNIVLTAKYKIKQYTVTFNYYDGRVENDSIKVEHGQEIPEDSFPQEDTGSKILTAWSTSTNEIVPFSGVVTENVTLYAFWKSYKVLKFYDGVNPEHKEERVFENETFTPESLSNRNGYTFKGWFDNEDYQYTTIKYNTYKTDFFAKWTVNQYNLTLNANGGTCDLSFITYNVETETFELPDARKANHIFLGWCKRADLSDTPVTELVEGTYGVTVLYAKYKGEPKTLILDAGSGYVSPSRTFIEYGKTFSLPVPTLDEHVFIGWYDGMDSSSNKITDDEGKGFDPFGFEKSETTLYAHYKEKLLITVDVNLKKAGGVSVAEYYLEGNNVNLKATLKKGYKFLGWYQDGELVNEQLEYKFTMGATDLALELRYEAKKYIVTLIPGDGATCDKSSEEVIFDEQFSLPVPIKQDYTFIGWKLEDEVITNTEGAGRAVWNTDDNVSLYAYFVMLEEGTIPVYDDITLLSMALNPSATYCLCSDVDMSGVTWTPFDFSGIFNGNGLTIKNLKVTSSSGALGVFKKFSGTMSNVTFENLKVTSTSYDSVYVGGICAEMTSGTLDNVIVKGSVEGDNCRIGGIAGKVSGGTISNCKNYAEVGSTTYEDAVSAGGITAHFAGGNINNCENHGDINIKQNVGGLIGWAQTENMTYLTNHGTVTGTNNVGGIVGLLERNGTYNLIVNFVNKGDVEGSECVAGGIAKITNSFNSGDNSNKYTQRISKITNNGEITGSKYVGGALGYLYGNVSGKYNSNNPSVVFMLEDLTNTGNIIGATYVGGLIGYGTSDNGESTLTRSSSSAVVTGEAIVGGLAGQIDAICMKECDNTDSTIIATGYFTKETTYYVYVGGYLGIGYYVENCINSVNITYDNIGICVGGIAGELSNPIKNCTNNGIIKATKSDYVGGLVGNLTCAWSYDVMNLTNTASVTGKNYTGGILGRIIDDFDAGDTSNTYTVKMGKFTNSGKVVGAEKVGGCIGYAHGNVKGKYNSNNPTLMFTCTELKNTGDVEGILYVGGLVGHMYTDNGSSQIAQSSSSANIKAEAYVGGLAGELENIQLISSSNENSTVTATKHYMSGDFYFAYLGGYVGKGYYFDDIHNQVEINYTGIGAYVGGISGYITSSLMNCSNGANVTASSSNNVGGLVGAMVKTWSYKSSDNVNAGNVTGKNRVGGIYGEIYNVFNAGDTSATYDVSLSKLTNMGVISGVTEVGGIVGYVYMKVDGKYSSNHPSARIIGSEWDSIGNVVATASEDVSVGGFAGYIETDHSGSALTIYTCTATVNGVAVTKETLIGKKTNFSINNI